MFQFIFPLPRGQGYEFILSQFTENEIHYTPLISYQVKIISNFTI